MKIKVLNLYAGIGGNRKLWDTLGLDLEITAVELNPEIAKIYQDFFPNDKVIVTDAHQYLLEHYKEYDFIWSSPPCPTHSRMRFLHHILENTRDTPYPDMTLYQEIIFLMNWFEGYYCVENVMSYYEPLIKPQISGNHYFWCNFNITDIGKVNRHIKRDNKKDKWDFDLSKYNLKEVERTKMLNNLVYPCLGLHIFKCDFKEKQKILGDLYGIK